MGKRPSRRGLLPVDARAGATRGCRCADDVASGAGPGLHEFPRVAGRLPRARSMGSRRFRDTRASDAITLGPRAGDRTGACAPASVEYRGARRVERTGTVRARRTVAAEVTDDGIPRLSQLPQCRTTRAF